MEIVRCDRGHFYDASVDRTCPKCAKMDAGMGGLDVDFSGAGVTMGVDTIGATVPVSGGVPEMMQTEAFDSSIPGVIGATVPVGGPVEEIGATTPIGFVPANGAPEKEGEAPKEFNPPVGWLVCVEGADKGSDFKIHTQNNYIGRSKANDICIPGDTHISSEKAAMVSYDDVDRTFYFTPSAGHNIIRCNGRPVFTAITLSAYDELTIGLTKLLFIPLCCERFDWNGR